MNIKEKSITLCIITRYNYKRGHLPPIEDIISELQPITIDQ